MGGSEQGVTNVKFGYEGIFDKQKNDTSNIQIYLYPKNYTNECTNIFK